MGNKEEWEKWGTLPFPYTVAVQQHVLKVLPGLPPVRLGSGKLSNQLFGLCLLLLLSVQVPRPSLQNLLDVSPRQSGAS
jgi:hypothetical protein